MHKLTSLLMLKLSRAKPGNPASVYEAGQSSTDQ